ncbi:MAG: DHHW family protein [Bacteroidota bacterium]
MSTGKHHRIMDAVNSLFFVTVLLSGGILFFLLPKKQISESENRRLAPLPLLTSDAFLYGNYSDSMEQYYSDNFIFRDSLIEWAYVFKDHFGHRDQDFQVFEQTSTTKKKSSESIEVAQMLISAAVDSMTRKTDSLSLEIEEEDIEPDDAEFQTINSIVISRGSAIQSFHGSNYSAQNFAKLVSEYRQAFGPDMDIFCMAIPVGSDFYLPASYTDNHHRESDFINEFYNNLEKSIIGVRAYENLAKHKSEYIKFNTDHHWTGRGAFYAYEAFCQAAGFTPNPMSAFTRKVIPNFLGSLYFRTKSADLRRNPDSVEYFKIPDPTRVSIYKADMSYSRSSNLYYETARGSGGYGVFLGGDHPLTQIISTPKTGKKLMIFKDSYGNAFAPFMASLYDEVYVVDYRYFEGSIRDVVNKFGITSILFCHNVYMFNAGYTVQRERALLQRKSGSKVELAKEVTKKDSTALVKSNAVKKPRDTEKEVKREQKESKTLKIHESKSSGTEIVRHKVKSGEDLYALSNEYAVSVDQIRKWNRLKDDEIKEGQSLFICVPKSVDSVSSDTIESTK